MPLSYNSYFDPITGSVILMVPNGDKETGGWFLFEMSTDQAHGLMEDINQALLDAEGKQ